MKKLIYPGIPLASKGFGNQFSAIPNSSTDRIYRPTKIAMMIMMTARMEKASISR
jgi:hypothetical protein